MYKGNKYVSYTCLKLSKVQHLYKHYLRYYWTLLFVHADDFIHLELSYVICTRITAVPLSFSGLTGWEWCSGALVES